MKVSTQESQSKECVDLGKTGLRQRQRAARDEAILNAAFDLIVQQGYEGLTMDGLADRVGISRQTLYHHFPSKDAIALRAVIVLFEQGIESINSIDPRVPPGERLRLVVTQLLTSRFKPTTAAFIRARITLMPIKSHPDYKDAFSRRAKVLETLVLAAQESGDIRSDISSKLVVQMLLGLVSDASYEDLIAEDSATVHDVIRTVVDLFFNGLRPIKV